MILHSGVIRAVLLSVWPLESAFWSELDWTCGTNGPAHTWYYNTNRRTHKGTEIFIRKETKQRENLGQCINWHWFSTVILVRNSRVQAIHFKNDCVFNSVPTKFRSTQCKSTVLLHCKTNKAVQINICTFDQIIHVDLDLRLTCQGKELHFHTQIKALFYRSSNCEHTLIDTLIFVHCNCTIVVLVLYFLY